METKWSTCWTFGIYCDCKQKIYTHFVWANSLFLLQTFNSASPPPPRQSNCQAITSPFQEDDGISLDRRSLAVTSDKPCNLPMLFHWRHFGSHFPWSHTDTHTAIICFWPCFWWPKFCFPQGLGSALPWLPVAQIVTSLHFSLVFAPAALNHHFPDCQFPH